MYTRAKVAGCIIPCDLSSRAEQPHPISHPISYPGASTAIAESSSDPINDPLVKQLYHGCVENILRRTTVGGWPSGYRASFLPAIFPSRYAISYPIWSSTASEQLPYQLLYGRQLTGGRSPVVRPEVWPEMWFSAL